MAFRQALRQRRVVVIAAASFAASSAFVPRPAFAEARRNGEETIKKPIYDDPNPLPPSPTSSTPPPSTQITKLAEDAAQAASSQPTPTDRLAEQVKAARLHLYDFSAGAEDSFNKFMARAFNLEHTFTSTIASLAPPREANEPVLPGLTYIFVAALAGSIVTRNRGIILRTSIPVALGISAAYYTLPTTMRNVEDFVWQYEEKYPAVADAHIKARERVERFVETGKDHTQMSLQMLEGWVGEGRKTIEDWVRKGK